MSLPWASALITREPKANPNLTKRRLFRLKVGFGYLSATLSNAWGAKKCVGDYYTVSIVALIALGL